MNDIDERRKNVGRRISAARKRRGMKQSELVIRLKKELGKTEMSSNSISQWEHGTTLPEYDTLFALAKVLECDVGYLLCDYDEPVHDAGDISQLTGLSVESAELLINWKKIGGNAGAVAALDKLIYDAAYGSGTYSVLNLMRFFFQCGEKWPSSRSITPDGKVLNYKEAPNTIYRGIRLDSGLIENAVLAEISQSLIELKNGIGGK